MNPFLIDATQFDKIRPTRKNRWAVTKYTILACSVLIGYIVGFGDPTSPLHQTALEYAFILVGTMSLGYALSAVVDNAVIFKGNKTTPVE